MFFSRFLSLIFEKYKWRERDITLISVIPIKMLFLKIELGSCNRSLTPNSEWDYLSNQLPIDFHICYNLWGCRVNMIEVLLWLFTNELLSLYWLVLSRLLWSAMKVKNSGLISLIHHDMIISILPLASIST